MTRDIEKRQHELGNTNVIIDRIALNYSQVEQYDLPPNFAKKTDVRFKEYQKKFGSECWELDALDSSVLNNLIKETVLKYRNSEALSYVYDQEKEDKQHMLDNWGY
ncbi:MAG: hypothetical protein JRF25_10870 [Deltaproteobacteria bacterium]|nr:hypothetical protein [Deltaproteobacteria bacterium]